MACRFHQITVTECRPQGSSGDGKLMLFMGHSRQSRRQCLIWSLIDFVRAINSSSVGSATQHLYISLSVTFDTSFTRPRPSKGLERAILVQRDREIND
jgi:hypothetical protein